MEIWGSVKKNSDVTADVADKSAKKSDMPAPSGGGTIERTGNQIYFTSEIDYTTAYTLNKLLREAFLEVQTSMIKYDYTGQIPIYLHINSPGGYLIDAFAVSDHIELITKRVPVYTVIEGQSASAATLISLVGTKRMITKNSFTLIHQLTSSCWGKYDLMKDNFQNTTMFMEKMFKLYERKTKIKRKELEKIVAHDLYLSAEDSLKKGLVDIIVQ